MIMKLAIAIVFGMFLVLAACTGCGGNTNVDIPPVDGGAGGSFDPYPCPISTRLICDECTKAGEVCGIWGVCAPALAAGPVFNCTQPCDHLANNDVCAPDRHCQAVEEGNPLAVCFPDGGK